VSIACSSAIAGVVVHARGALVRRAVELPKESAAAGELELLVPGVTPLAEGGSMRAELIAPGRRVARVGCELVIPEGRATVGPSVERLQGIDAEIARLSAERDKLVERGESLSSLSPLPRVGIFSRQPFDARVKAAIDHGALVAELLARVDARRRTIEEKLEAQQREREKALLEDQQASSVARAGRGHPTRTIRVVLDGDGPIERLEVSYVVPGARWWPVYDLRVSDGGARATWTIEALVAQASGEEWRGVQLALSTADLIADARLPELPSLRWGRAQARPKRGYRPAPEGLARMFAGFDAAFPSLPPEPAVGGEVTESLSLESELRYKDRPAKAKKRAGAPRGARSSSVSVPPPPSAPPPPAAASFASTELQRAVMDNASTKPFAREAPMDDEAEAAMTPPFGGAAWRSEPATIEPAAIEPADAWLDFDALTLGLLSDPERRGRLSPDQRSSSDRHRARAGALIEAVAPSASVRDPRDSRGQFDHRWDCDGAAEVPSDGKIHRVHVTSGATVPQLAWRTVPRETAEVYREATLPNPFDAPLLAGPVDVYVEGTLLAQTGIEQIDKGGLLRVGMGVEERIRVARNARADEDTAGLLGGSTVVDHAVTIDLTSSLGRPARVEVLDRLAVSDEKGLEVALEKSQPPPERYDQAERGMPVRGGLRWWIELPAGGKRTIELRWRLTLPSKNEVIGGNRRE
jgi:hypothetical protein